MGFLLLVLLIADLFYIRYKLSRIWKLAFWIWLLLFFS
jgi:hypothetical protein